MSSVMTLAMFAALAAGTLSSVVSSTAYAGSGELRELYRGTRATGLGGAFTAIADDEEAIFYNPAAMAGNDRLRAYPVIFDAELASGVVTGYSTYSEKFKNLSPESLNGLMGQDIYFRGQITPSLVGPNFGVALISDHQGSLVMTNQAQPQITLGYQSTNGMQFAYGTSLLGHRGNHVGNDLRVGVGGKLLWRRGGYKDLSTIDIMNISKDTLHKVAGPYEMGYGLDLGSQYIHPINNDFKLMGGVAWTDIGDTHFGASSEPIKNNLSVGAAASYRSGPLVTTNIAYDYRHALTSTDWRKRNHIGLEFKLPVFSLYGGVSQTSFTYGGAIDLWLIRVMAVSYAEEMGIYANQHSQRRWLFHMGFKVAF